MSARQRAEAEELRAKYARSFRIPKEDVVIEFGEDEDASVFHKSDVRLPRWSLGARRPASLSASLYEFKRS